MLEKTFDPKSIELKHYKNWEKLQAFKPKPSRTGKTYTIFMPPPNVTGRLHIGHALNHTLQDILIRYHRMLGDETLWQPGMDHAGIATQSVVERNLEKEGVSRHDLGREKFVEKVWEWKEESGGAIGNQLRLLGTSPDWSRERFTMDKGMSQAVQKVFIDLYNEGLIYRDKRLVNWDPKLGTAVSDLEVNNIEIAGKMWHIRYPIEGMPGEYINVATTRPETMLGDTGIAVHPDDERYTHLVGKYAILPLVNRKIPIVTDEYSDPAKGTGAVKITPAHDFNDFEVGVRNKLEIINILDKNACINENAPQAYQGLDRFKAREVILKDLAAQGFLVDEEDKQIMVPHGEKSGVVIEPLLTDQWFADAKTLAQPAIKAVKDGKTTFTPKNWEKTYFEWLNNIQPWCISRQLWWGHRIPAWYGPDEKIFVASSKEEANEQATKHYGKSVSLRHDEDVLDTWFSSALWPFSTLGWPEETPELQKFYPGDEIVTGFDIIFFWIARMMMMSLHFKHEVPFRNVCVTALVRDEHGQKMSKSKGNVIDPMEYMEKFGSDALRFSLAALAGPGRDVNFSPSQVEGYRNFATKIWNAFRYCQSNECFWDEKFNPDKVSLTLNKWIISEVKNLGVNVADSIGEYRFDELCANLYQFIWGKFCDWYIELTKPVLISGSPEQIAEVRATCAWVMGQIVHLLHPVMPFLTEELWQHLNNEDLSHPLIISQWPEYAKSGPTAKSDSNQIEWLIQLITEIRTIRAEMNIPGSTKLDLYVINISDQAKQALSENNEAVLRMARINNIHTDSKSTDTRSLELLIGTDKLQLILGDKVDLDKEKKRIIAQIGECDSEIAQIGSKLANENFVSRAPAEVIETNRKRYDEAVAKKDSLNQTLARLGNL